MKREKREEGKSGEKRPMLGCKTGRIREERLHAEVINSS